MKTLVKYLLAGIFLGVLPILGFELFKKSAKPEPRNIVTVPGWCPYKFRLPATWKLDRTDHWLGWFIPSDPMRGDVHLRLGWGGRDKGDKLLQHAMSMMSAQCNLSNLAEDRTADGKVAQMAFGKCVSLERDEKGDYHPAGSPWSIVLAVVEDRKAHNSMFVKSELRDVREYEQFLRQLIRTYFSVDECESQLSYNRESWSGLAKIGDCENRGPQFLSKAARP